MTEETSRDGYVVVELPDGSLVEGCWPAAPIPPGARYLDEVFGKEAVIELFLGGEVGTCTLYWYDGGLHLAPRKPPRPPAPWRIWPVNREWRIEKRLTDGYETWCRFDTSGEAFSAFAAGGER